MPTQEEPIIYGCVSSEKSQQPFSGLEKKVFSGIKTRQLIYLENYPINGKIGCAIRFGIDNVVFFPALIENYREFKVPFQLSMEVFVKGKKINIDLLK